jgi:FkbM family methyltransferase
MDKSIESIVCAAQYHSYPEHQQDRWVIETVFRGKRGGYFVEAGVGGMSNTETLEAEYGWTGLGVEPHPGRFAQVQAKRSCHLENVALTDKPGEVTFILNEDAPGTSGIEGQISGTVRKMAYAEGKRYPMIRIPGVPLWELLRKHGAPKIIDYLSLDLEGAEFMALKDFPFDEYSFTCMTIERGSENTGRLRRLLASRGYDLVRIFAADDFWVHPRVGYRAPLADRLNVALRRAVNGARDLLHGR